MIIRTRHYEEDGIVIKNNNNEFKFKDDLAGFQVYKNLLLQQIDVDYKLIEESKIKFESKLNDNDIIYVEVFGCTDDIILKSYIIKEYNDEIHKYSFTTKELAENYIDKYKQHKSRCGCPIPDLKDRPEEIILFSSIDDVITHQLRCEIRKLEKEKTTIDKKIEKIKENANNVIGKDVVLKDI